jgi:cytochrome c oxidase assembly protein subunit 15
MQENYGSLFFQDSYRSWLKIGLFLLISMILLGGATRLYHAGLSIVEWELFKGVFPPLSEVQWQRYFYLYQQCEEYKQFHSWMDLSDFKTIFWFEYSHRLLGRIIGLWFLLPTLKITFSSSFPTGVKKNLWGINAFIILQGVIGWYMVKSGLGKNLAVSHYRLALHLTMALFIISWVIKMLSVGKVDPFLSFSFKKTPLYSFMILFGLTILYGVFVAGLKAGLIYNTFPLMEGQIFPSDGWFYYPLILNFFKNPSLVQFIHRLLGMTLVGGGWMVFFYYQTSLVGRYFLVIALLLTMQAVLGVASLLTQLNFFVALAHQAGAVLLWCCLSRVYFSFFMQRESKKNSQDTMVFIS